MTKIWIWVIQFGTGNKGINNHRPAETISFRQVYYQEGKSMSRKYLYIFCSIAFLATILSIVLVSIFTIPPTKISGNGNIGLIFVPFAVIFYLSFLLTSFLLLRGHLSRWFSMIFGLILLVISFYQEYYLVSRQINTLGGWIDNPNSKIYRLNWVNQYTNDMWINMYTFLFGIAILFIIISIYGKTKKR